MTKRGIGYVLLVCAVLVGACTELFARYYLGLGHPPLSQSHPTIEYLFKPNQDVQRFGNRFITNRYSMRTEDFPPRKATPDELRVMVYGDSVVNGGNLTDHSRLATTMLQRRLREILHRPVIVGNISAGSWGPPNQLAYLRQFGLLDADVVILVLSSHDFADAPTFAPLDPHTHPTEEPWSATWEGIARYLPRYLHSASPPDTLPLGPNVEQLVNPRDIEVSLGAEREFLQTVASAGVVTILLQHWTMQELHERRAGLGHDEILRVAETLRVPASDDDAALRNSVAAGRNPFRDDIHLNEAGQVALEGLMFEALQRDAAQKLLPASH